VEIGAIKIYLDRFSESARNLILERRQPLGTILRIEAIPHISRPAAYFQVEPDPVIREALELTNSPPLFGRRNVLLNTSEDVLANVLEILPPYPDRFRQTTDVGSRKSSWSFG